MNSQKKRMWTFSVVDSDDIVANYSTPFVLSHLVIFSIFTLMWFINIVWWTWPFEYGARNRIKRNSINLAIGLSLSRSPTLPVPISIYLGWWHLFFACSHRFDHKLLKVKGVRWTQACVCVSLCVYLCLQVYKLCKHVNQKNLTVSVVCSRARECVLFYRWLKHFKRTIKDRRRMRENPTVQFSLYHAFSFQCSAYSIQNTLTLTLTHTHSTKNPFLDAKLNQMECECTHFRQ